MVQAGCWLSPEIITQAFGHGDRLGGIPGQDELGRIEDRAIQGLPAWDEAQIEAMAELILQPDLALRRGQRGLKQPTTALLDLINEKRQHHQMHQHGA